jgi:hypothetical protein
MYSTEYGKATKKESFTTGTSERLSSYGERLPTLDKRLDSYFDQHMEAIIHEWGLVTTHDLAVFERRLEDASREIRELESGQSRLKIRASAIDAALKELEKS